MTLELDLIELYAGLGAVSLAAVGASKPVVSRVGSKAGYTKPILKALGIKPGSAKRVLLVEADTRVADVLHTLLGATVPIEERRRHTADLIQLLAHAPAREVWEEARRSVFRGSCDPAMWLLFTAGARGGVGGFKGGHKHRPSVDGFIPSRSALAERVRSFYVPSPALGRELGVVCEDVAALDPSLFSPTAVYLDPPYGDSELLKWPNASRLSGIIAEKWRAAGHRVVLSERVRPVGLSAAFKAKRITEERTGQCRRSLTKSAEEWLFVAGD